MRVLAPGKLILSGEHAVVYGQPALAMAVNRYVTASAIAQPWPQISFNLTDLAYEKKIHLSSLLRIKSRIKNKYERFVRGEFKIRDVLQKPVELAQFAFTIFLEALNIKLNQGVCIHVASDIPIGCGMGSSAATILSIARAIAQHLGIHLSHETLLQLGLEAENMQHGFSSGLDLRVSLQGGCLYIEDNHVYERSIPTFELHFVNTGSPQSTTGECVAHAAKYFKNSTIAKDFAAVTKGMDAAMQNNHLSQVKDYVRQNSFLLSQIAVVPSSVQRFVHAIEEQGGAAKICGAGSVRGDQAGVMLVIIEDKLHLEKICDQFNYSILPIRPESRGVHVVI